MPVITPSTKEVILLAAERLFAQHGISGVSMRQIGAAAGTSNNSAVQYHFGSKDGLVEAILSYRLPGFHQRRALLIAERHPGDLRGWVGCQVLPTMEQSETPGSHYLGFLSALLQHEGRGILRRLPEDTRRSAIAVSAQLADQLPHLPRPLRTHRIDQATLFITRAGADRERARAEGLPVLDFGVEVADLVDGVTGFLQAPASQETLSALACVQQAAGGGRGA
jgi:AcrR family transcriptional regulator